MTSPPIPDLIRAARRLAEDIQGVEVIADLAWFPEEDKWGFACELTIETTDGLLVPARTNWYVLLENSYPRGRIIFYPGKKGGITSTFPHQKYNDGNESSAHPWRKGELCLRAPQYVFGKDILDPDPIGQPDRIGWHFLRALEWLKMASSGTLLAEGEYFELPVFSQTASKKESVAFNETPNTLRFWEACPEKFGYAQIVRLDNTDQMIIKGFCDRKGKDILSYSWGQTIAGSADNLPRAVWIRSNVLPIKPPYQAPMTWGELREVFATSEPELGESLQNAADLVRDGDQHILLLGFPVPRLFGGPSEQMFWQPMTLPVVSHGTLFAKGFRPGAHGYGLRDRTHVFTDHRKISWLNSENWGLDEVSSRGRFGKHVVESKVAMIGVGAVGSVVAELLVRGGTSRILLLDEDEVEIGNLCRHLLGMSSLGQAKSEAVASRLNGANPHASIEAIPKSFQDLDESEQTRLRDCSVIFDCSGADEVLWELGAFDWKKPQLFVSLSLSYAAQRIYVFTHRGSYFPIEGFREKMKAWLEKDKDEFGDQLHVRSGIGCWHLAFPARVDDIWMLVAAAMRRFDEVATSDGTESRLTVFERTADQKAFSGLKKNES